MKALLRRLEHHVFETLGVPIATRPWEKHTGLPQYLRERYDFFETVLLGHPYVLMVDKGDVEQTPATVAKHLAQVQTRTEAEVIFVGRAATSYNRKRLIQQKVPFIIPGNQLYLPTLGIDLREHLRRAREKKACFSPATQVVLLHILWLKEPVTVTPSGMAAQLGYAAMTMTRAFNELEEAGIGEHAMQGKERHMRLTETGRALWEKGLPRLGTPVRKIQLPRGPKRPGPIQPAGPPRHPGLCVSSAGVEKPRPAGNRYRSGRTRTGGCRNSILEVSAGAVCRSRRRGSAFALPFPAGRSG